ncbi:MAG: cytochrome P450 [Acidimicrobiales bacterium]
MVPFVGSGLGLLRDPTAWFERQRARHGETFVADAFGFRLFCVLGPVGVRSLYALPEAEASFRLATYRLIGFKLPPELLRGRRNTPHSLFGASDVERYLRNLEAAVAAELDELGDAGHFEVFAEMKRLGHRLGLASWAGNEVASPRHLDRLIPALDAVDSSEAFVRPAQAFRTWATRRRRERAAMATVEGVIGEVLAERRATGRLGCEDDFLDHIHESFADLPAGEREVATARDVILIHSGAQSNLYAALAWTLVDLLAHPELLVRVRAGDDGLLDQCASESIRMAQRSITLREVLRPIEVEAEGGTFHLVPGTFVTTMLSANNRRAAPGLDAFDPAHYTPGRRALAHDVPVATKEMVSTFGHGSHSCPAARFSISAIRVAVRALVDRYDLVPRYASVTPRRRQIGAVARAARPAVVDYRRR